MPDARTPPPPALCRSVAAIVLVNAVIAAGCEMRDEQALVGRAAWWWPASVGPPTAGGLIDGSPVAPDERPAIEYVEGFAAGSRRAADNGLPMLVVFRAGWCRWSNELAAAVAADRNIVALSRRFVCVTVDADRDPATCREFAVEAFPTVLLLEADGNERHRAVGAGAAETLASSMAGVLETGLGAGLAGRDRDPVR